MTPEKQRIAIAKACGITITNQEADILIHASNNNGRYVTEEPVALDLAERGLFENRGRWALAGGAFALMLTAAGRAAINEWRAAQPKPKAKKRRTSPAFESWRHYCEANGRFGFGDFLKLVWPRVKDGSFFR